MAQVYRELEVPFVVRGVPDLEEARARWTPGFLRDAFTRMRPGEAYKIERSTRKGHFLYYSKARAHRGIRGATEPSGPAWVPPQESAAELSYSDFEAAASAAGQRSTAGRPAEHLLYLTISAGVGAFTDWVVGSLAFFRDDHDFFRVNFPEEFHGINCRFGMRGIVQAAHYDHGRNFIAMVHGHKRYVILPPRTCKDLELLGFSQVSWSRSFASRRGGGVLARLLSHHWHTS